MASVQFRNNSRPPRMSSVGPAKEDFPRSGFQAMDGRPLYVLHVRHSELEPARPAIKEKRESAKRSRCATPNQPLSCSWSQRMQEIGRMLPTRQKAQHPRRALRLIKIDSITASTCPPFSPLPTWPSSLLTWPSSKQGKYYLLGFSLLTVAGAVLDGPSPLFAAHLAF
jgi:hypothetical protein